MDSKRYLRLRTISQAGLAAVGGMLSAPSASGGETAVYPVGVARTLTRKKKVVRAKSFKQKVLSVQPAMHETQGVAASLLQNTIYALSPTYAVTQGDGVADRHGDSIYLEALKISGHFDTNSSAAGYMLRVIIGYTPQEVSTGTSWSSSAMGGPQVFKDNTYPVSLVDGIVDSKRFQVLFDEVQEIQSQISGVVDVKVIRATVPLKRWFNYKTSGGVYGSKYNLVVVVIADRYGATSGLDNAGYVSLSYDLIFKS